VTGFKGGDWNAYEDYFMVRNSDAHAWCEIYDGRTGWIRVDPTDGSAPINADAQSVADESRTLKRRSDRTWGARLDAVRILWYRRIVSFDQRTQLSLVVGIKETAGHFGAALRALMGGAFHSLRGWGNRPWETWRVLRWMGGALAAAAAGVLGWRLGRGSWLWHIRGWRRKGMDPVRREAGRWLRKLGRSGRSQVEGGSILAELQRLRYGPRSTWPVPQRVFRRARRALRGRRVI
jgi:hypothetical protein